MLKDFFLQNPNVFFSYDEIKYNSNLKNVSNSELRAMISMLRDEGEIIISKKYKGYCLVNLKTCSKELAKEAMTFLKTQLEQAKVKANRFKILIDRVENE